MSLCPRMGTASAVALLLVSSGPSGCGRGADPAVDAGLAPTKTLAPLVEARVPVDREKAELGRLLFFDQRLSGDGSMSCGTCHDPEKGFVDRLRTASGKGGKVLLRNTPSVINIDARAPFFWDGRAATAEEQALGPVSNPDEMAKDVGELVLELERSGYMGWYVLEQDTAILDAAPEPGEGPIDDVRVSIAYLEEVTAPTPT